MRSIIIQPELVYFHSLIVKNGCLVMVAICILKFKSRLIVSLLVVLLQRRRRSTDPVANRLLVQPGQHWTSDRAEEVPTLPNCRFSFLAAALRCLIDFFHNYLLRTVGDGQNQKQILFWLQKCRVIASSVVVPLKTFLHGKTPDIEPRTVRG